MTSAGDWVAWVWPIVGGALAVSGLGLLLWALLADRSRGRRRCPRCWYDMSATPGLTCSECGRKARRERQLFRTRRRWRWAIVAIVMIAGAWPIHRWPRVASEGWWAFVPSRALVWTWIVKPGYSTSHWNVMLLRSNSGAFDEADWCAMIERCAIGDPWARPISRTWKAKYGRILQGIRSNWARLPQAYGEPTERLWASLPMQVSVPASLDWPEGVPIHVPVRVIEWWRYPAYFGDAQITSSLEGAEPSSTIGGNRYVILPPLPAGLHSINLNIEHVRRDVRRPPDIAEVIDREQRVITVNVSGSPEDRLEPWTSSELVDSLRATVKPQFSTAVLTGQRPASTADLHLNLDRFAQDELHGVAIGLAVELIRDDRVVARWYYWGAGAVTDQQGHWKRFAWHAEPWIGRYDSGIDFRKGSVCIRSDPGLALRVPGCTRYWVGEVTVSIESD